MPRQSADVRDRHRAPARRDRRTGDGRYREGRATRPHLHEPHHAGLSGVLRILRHGRDDRAHRRLPAPRRAGSRRAQADHVSAWPGRRRQVIARRAVEGTDGSASHLCAEGRRPVEPGVREPARAVQSRAHGSDAGRPIRHSAAPADRTDEPVVHQATRRIRRRHLALPRCQDAAVAAAPDRHRQDRAGRREQPGHLLACGQGRYPQAGVALAERPRRLQLFRRSQPRQPGTARVRRDVQGADQDAAPVADRDAGRQLHRHREHRRHPVPWHHPGPLQRGGVADLQEQPQQRSLHRPHLRDQGAVLPARHGRAEDLRQAGAEFRTVGVALRAGDAGDAGALLGADAAAAARELDAVRQDAGL